MADLPGGTSGLLVRIPRQCRALRPATANGWRDRTGVGASVASGSDGGSRTDPVDGDFAPGISRWRQIRGLGYAAKWP
jgi:hypothetical protein